jgi:hypothetical protein
MDDKELYDMDLGALQDDGVIFMWVTGASPQAARAHRSVLAAAHSTHCRMAGERALLLCGVCMRWCP